MNSLYQDSNSNWHIVHRQRSTLPHYCTYHSCIEQHFHWNHSIHYSANYFGSKHSPHRQQSMFCLVPSSGNGLTVHHSFHYLCCPHAKLKAALFYTEFLHILDSYCYPEMKWVIIEHWSLWYFVQILFTFPHKLTRQYVNDSRKIIVKTTRRRSMRMTAAHHIVLEQQRIDELRSSVQWANIKSFH